MLSRRPRRAIDHDALLAFPRKREGVFLLQIKILHTQAATWTPASLQQTKQPRSIRTMTLAGQPKIALDQIYFHGAQNSKTMIAKPKEVG